MPHIPDVDAMGPFAALRRDIHAHPKLGFEEHRTLPCWQIVCANGI